MKGSVMTIVAVAGFLLAPAQADTLYRGSLDPSFDHINTTTFNIDLALVPDDGIFSLAVQPGTNTLFGVTDEVGGDGLVTIDPATGAMTFVVQMLDPGDPFPYFSNITFMPDGSLYTIATPDCGWTPGAILQVDMGTGVLTDTGLTYGGFGAQALEFNPDDGLFYHFYNDAGGGTGATFLDTVDPVTGTVTPITVSGYDLNAVNGLVYAGDGKFYAYDNTVGDLLEITTGGEVTLLYAYGVGGTFMGHGLALETYIPEPTTLSLVALGGLVALRRRR